MSVFDQQADAMRCPDCALVGIASFTNEKASAAKFRLPEGFKVVATDEGDKIYCAALTLTIDP